MSEYIQSKNIEDEERRLQLIGKIANNNSKEMLLKIKEFNPEIKKILDAGCGSGDAFQTIKEVFPHASLIGLDQSEKIIEVAKQKNIADRLIAEDLYDLENNEEFKKETPFDLIFIRNTLIHIKNPKILLNNLKNYLDSNGVIFLQESDWSFANADWDDFMIFKKSMIEMMESNNINPFIGGSVKSFLKKNGFQGIKEEVFTNVIKSEDETCDILYLLLEVAGEKINPFLQKYGVSSKEEMKERFKKARNSFKSWQTPAWVIVYGIK